MRAHHRLAAVVLCLLAAGCARFELYADENKTKRIHGFKYYTAKPYILVGRTGSTDEPFSISQVYLPDIANAVYADAQPGWLGNSVLTMEFNDNGTLKTFGQEGNNGISDLVGQLGGFAKNLAEAQALRAAAKAEDPVTQTEAKSVAQMLETAHRSADRTLNNALAGRKPERDAFNGPTEMLALTAKELANLAVAPDRHAIEARLRGVLAGWDAQTRALRGAKEAEVDAGLADARAIVRAAIRRIRAGMEADAHFTLYELVYDKATERTKLREVTFTK